MSKSFRASSQIILVLAVSTLASSETTHANLCKDNSLGNEFKRPTQLNENSEKQLKETSPELLELINNTKSYVFSGLQGGNSTFLSLPDGSALILTASHTATISGFLTLQYGEEFAAYPYRKQFEEWVNGTSKKKEKARVRNIFPLQKQNSASIDAEYTYVPLFQPKGKDGKSIQYNGPDAAFYNDIPVEVDFAFGSINKEAIAKFKANGGIIPDPANLAPLKDGENVLLIGEDEGKQRFFSYGPAKINKEGHIQTDAVARVGMSGGGVFNCSGALIGILVRSDLQSFSIAIPIQNIAEESLVDINGRFPLKEFTQLNLNLMNFLSKALETLDGPKVVPCPP